MNDGTPADAPIVGAWRLVSFEIRGGEDGVVTPFGPDPAGMLIYHPSGQFSAQAMRTGRPPFASGDQMQGTPEEFAASCTGVVSYFGHFDFHEADGYVVHHVEHSLFPNWEGDGQKRFYELRGDRLTLSTPPTRWGGREVIAALEWKRNAVAG